MNPPKEYLPKKYLEHGMYYAGVCRNASIARWNGTKQEFVHWRHKFGHEFVETIKHPEDEQHFDVFYPVIRLNRLKEIPLDD